MKSKLAFVGLLLVLGVPWAKSEPMDSAIPSIKEQRQKAVNRQRRLIVNYDGSEPVMNITRPSGQDLLDVRISPLANTQVDALFYCTRSSGFGMFTHFTKVGEVYTTTEGRYENNQMQAFLDLGIDPFQVIVDFCKKNEMEIFWSMRMNDNHDGTSAFYAPLIFRANKWKNAHPELLMGTPKKRPKIGAWSAVDYGQPEVRDLAFRFFEEVCQNYDIDGVELDFFRHPVFFKSNSQGKKANDVDRAAMTDLVRRIRKMADEEGMKRGRPILVAVRAPDSVKFAQHIGLDIEEWMSEGLLDIYIPAGSFRLNDWDYSVNLGHKYGIKVYPSLDDSRVTDPTAKKMRMTDLAYRGRAANAWAAEPDGIYLYNYHDPDYSLCHELGDPKQVAALDKDYFGTARGVKNSSAGNLPLGPYTNIETLIPENPKTVSPGNSATAKLQMGESFDENSRATVKLRLQFKSPIDSKLLRATFNGEAIELVSAKGNWLESSIELPFVRKGRNEIEVSLADAAPKKVVWTDVMSEVRRQSSVSRGQ